jgi:predicted ATP-grasp superfamily ATP-dependent carboligase
MIIKKNAFSHGIFKSRMPIAIVFTMQVQGLGIARSLSREGISVLAIDHDIKNYGLHSRYVTSILSPNAAEQENSFIDFMIDMGKALKNKGVLFPTHDPELLVLSKHRKSLEKYYLYPMAEYRIIQRCVDKFKLYPDAEKIGIPIPKTFFPESPEEAKEIADKIEYPSIVKPDMHDKFHEVFDQTALFASNKKELLKQYCRALDKELKVMIQEFIQGGAGRLYTLGSYADKGSNLLGIFTAKKIRQFPTYCGTCRVAEPVEEPRIVELGSRLIKGMNYHGVSQVEFKKDPRDEKFKLMEINARNWMWISLPTSCGVNLPLIAYKDTVGEKTLSPIRQNQISTKWTYLDNDFKNCCLGGYKKDGHPEESLNVFHWIKSVRGKKELAVFSWDDPKPFLFSYMNKAKNLLLKFSRFKKTS